MHSIKIDIEDSIYSHIMFFLKNLDKEQIRIVEDKKIETQLNNKESIKKLFETKQNDLFASIEDPLQWQKQQRDKW